MPGMSGLELQEELRRRGHTIPIVFISAHIDNELRSRLQKSGAVECLLKPFSDTALEAAIALALQSHGPRFAPILELAQESSGKRGKMDSTTSQEVPLVYIVDDDVAMREAIEGLIREAGWRPLTFASAKHF